MPSATEHDAGEAWFGFQSGADIADGRWFLHADHGDEVTVFSSHDEAELVALRQVTD